MWGSKSTRNSPALSLGPQQQLIIVTLQKDVIVKIKPVGRDFWTIPGISFFVKFIYMVVVYPRLVLQNDSGVSDFLLPEFVEANAFSQPYNCAIVLACRFKRCASAQKPFT